LVFFGQEYFHKNLWKFAVIIGSYFIMNLAYTFRLKHVAIVDIFIIAIGFVLRVLAEVMLQELKFLNGQFY
jgi:4-hydroxybenzoate polyprenyltransferase